MSVKKNHFKLLLGIFGTTITLSLLLLVFVPAIGHAALIPICTATGNCGVCDIVNMAITIGKWLITGAGGLALLVIVWAAFGFVNSAGNAEKIGESKKQIIGALLGMAIVMMAFQLVMLIIFLLATPASSLTYEASQPENTEAERFGSLSHFLEVPWWDICDAKELRVSNWDYKTNKTHPKEREFINGTYKGTGICRYWGDGTPCMDDFSKICISGTCVESHTVVRGPNKDDVVKNPCEFLAAYDLVYEGYKCVKQYDLSKPIEEELCPDAEDGAKLLCGYPVNKP